MRPIPTLLMTLALLTTALAPAVNAQPVDDTAGHALYVGQQTVDAGQRTADAGARTAEPVDDAVDGAAGIGSDLADDPPGVGGDPGDLPDDVEPGVVRIYNAAVTFGARLRNDAIIWLASIKNDAVEGLARVRNDAIRSLASLRNDLVIAAAELRNGVVRFTAGTKNDAVIAGSRATDDAIGVGAATRNGLVEAGSGTGDAATGAATTVAAGGRGLAGNTVGSAADVTHPPINLLLDVLAGEEADPAGALPGTDSLLQPESRAAGQAPEVVPFEPPMPRHIDNCPDAERFYAVGIRWIEDGRSRRRSTCLPYDATSATPPTAADGARTQPWRVRLCDQGQSCGSMRVRLILDEDDREAELRADDLTEGERVYAIRVEVGDSAFGYRFYGHARRAEHPERLEATIHGIWVDLDRDPPFNLLGDPVRVAETLRIQWDTFGEDRDTTRFVLDKDTTSQHSWHGLELGDLVSVSLDRDDRTGLNPHRFRFDVTLKTGDPDRFVISRLAGLTGAAVALHHVTGDGPIVLNPLQDQASLTVRHEGTQADFRMTVDLDLPEGTRLHFARLSFGPHHVILREIGRLEDLAVERGSFCDRNYCIEGTVKDGGGIHLRGPVFAGISHLPVGTVDLAWGGGNVDVSVTGNDETRAGVEAYVSGSLGFDHLWIGGLDSLTFRAADSIAEQRIEATFTERSIQHAFPYVVLRRSGGDDTATLRALNVATITKPAGSIVDVFWHPGGGSLRLEGRTRTRMGNRDVVLTSYLLEAHDMVHFHAGATPDGEAPFTVSHLRGTGNGWVRIEAVLRMEDSGVLDPCESSATTLEGRIAREDGDRWHATGSVDAPGVSACHWDGDEILGPQDGWTFEAFDRVPVFRFEV